MRQDLGFFKKICEQTQREFEITLKGGSMKPGFDLWMETRIRKGPSLTPARVAYECCYYKKVDPTGKEEGRNEKEAGVVRGKSLIGTKTISEPVAPSLGKVESPADDEIKKKHAKMKWLQGT